MSEEAMIPRGARILVRDEEWMVTACEPAGPHGAKIEAIGVSEFARDTTATFFTKVEEHAGAGVQLMRPEDTVLVADHSPKFARSRLFLEAILRRTPLPQTERRLAMADGFLLNPLRYQRRPAELALKGLRPRILLADVVGLGKTLEIGLTLAELIRRGRGEKILVVTPQHVLEQFQHELWTRFSIPLIRLDSIGIERIQREIPAGRNPFTYYKKVIVSIDTLKNPGKYGQHLEHIRWDAVVIDESHNLISETSARNKLARLLAGNTDALLLASATPHNGDARSFAELINLLDPTAIVNPRDYSAKDIEHLYIRRTKVNPEVRDEVGDQWPDRGPSVSLHCPATPPEEEVLGELAGVWLAADGPATGKGRRLFPYTLIKSFLSSHKALAATVANRLKNSTDARERQALERLAELTGKIGDDDSAKLATLVAKLKQIGVRPGSAERVVVFSESVPTLNWLKQIVPARLGFSDADVAGGVADVLHGDVTSDQEQQRIVERFSLADSSVRILFTGNVASEGVNLHRQCHQLIHYDLPWSLIRIEQRNGRIDRYGQRYQPQFTALILKSAVKERMDDTTVAEVLLKREEAAHNSLGTAETVTGLYSGQKEEDRLLQDLLKDKTAEESLDSAHAEGGILTAILGLEEDHHLPEQGDADVPRLFATTEAFVDEAIKEIFKDPARDLELERTGRFLALRPPEDLIHRMRSLPRSYLKTHAVGKRMRVTFDRADAQRKLDEARRTKTIWPDTAYLTDLHPLVEWLVDKVLVRLGRQTAPVLLAQVPEPAFLVQGIYSNALGQPAVVRWMTVTGLPNTPAVRDDMPQVLKEAGVGPGMWNPDQERDLSRLQRAVPAAVAAARHHLEAERARYEQEIEDQLDSYRGQLGVWVQETLDLVVQDGRLKTKVGAVEKRQRDLLDSLQITGEPLLRLLAVLDGGA
ncbi:DEAD/DEAH box helicase [Microbispora sp. NBC_01189]|uniref:DEAD/DEAH box helicase n=1 Tax=Microbispora sp. NBC_01189 TaxID=2903583 RepID=UPI002E122552|nr:DEAD/DEAH box helicase [Microbispora sp. NBC_01189]